MKVDYILMERRYQMVLVVYDSQFGNTKEIAEAIAQSLNGKTVRVQDFTDKILKEVTLLIAGCPIHGRRPSKSMIAFLESLPDCSLNGIQVASFDTRVKFFFAGDAAGKINKKLIQLGGVSVVIPEKFFVKGKEGPLSNGELERAKKWAQQLQVYSNTQAYEDK